MKNPAGYFVANKTILTALSISLFLSSPILNAQQETEHAQSPTLVEAQILNPTTVDILLPENKRMTLDFYGENIFRLFRDDTGGIIRDPQAKPEAKILVCNPRKPVSKILVNDKDGIISITTSEIRVQIDKKTSLLKVINLKNNSVAFEQTEPALIEDNKVFLALKSHKNEYFFGGGVQNGRFSHKGKIISIENQNSWTDGGVASPAPYYWSTNGYAVMWHTFKKGKYDFGSTEADLVKLSHEDTYLDVFFMISEDAVGLLNDFYQLTGNPVLMPKFGFYQGHLNAYNRDYWREDEKGTLFEDGKRYKESSKESDGGVRESLNGENNNYQFSARAVIDRYKAHDMPLGWLLPNDGYGAGYGQTETLDGNIQNLKNLTEYAQKHGVEIGLWTQSDLHPKPDVSALLQRDIVKEVRDAGVRVLKTDVAWVGAGYSFGLNGITDVANIMTYYGNNSRPFIISLDGWAGTQRYAGIWSGDQTGGAWEYIRFHIPTYIGSGLSGQPNISSDMDGIFGGKNIAVNTRDFQWKTFTPMELNMDGWGSNEKYPHAMGEPATSINRWYLKLKSELMPYTYSIAREAVDGLPMIRAMFLEYPNTYTLGKSTQYQFLFGPSFLVAPIYQETKSDENHNDIRNGIYLPEGQWIDYFTGNLFEGNRIINNYDAPLWKLPVFVKNGAIIPLTNPNNNVTEIIKDHRIYEFYPKGHTAFTEYDDDGVTEEYKLGNGTKTLINSIVDHNNTAIISISPTTGEFAGFVKEKSTEFRINVTNAPSNVSAKIGNTSISLIKVDSKEDFLAKDNVYYYEKAPNLNQYATKDSEFSQKVITKNPLLLVKLAKSDTTAFTTSLIVEGFEFSPTETLLLTSGDLTAPTKAEVSDENITAYTLKPTWAPVSNADYYEIKFNGMLYSTIKEHEFLFEDLKPETTYTLDLRAVNKDGHSIWTNISATTKSNPLEFAIPGIVGETSVPNQGNSITKLFDFQEGDQWHTKHNEKAVPFDLIMDLQTINQLEKFHYIPRDDSGNGTILKGTISYSMDKETWSEAETFEWAKDNETKIFTFKASPSARYIKMHVTEGVGNYGSGKEIYVFKVPGTESYLPGDINNDGKIDRNDLTSYTNYTGLRRGDADFEGYISNGDINKNDLIDAYDISNVATRLDGGVDSQKGEKVEGKLIFDTAKKDYNQGEEIEIQVKGENLRSVNALSFALPYNQQDYEFVGIQPQNMKNMENLTNDRLHTSGEKSLYPTFINIGKKDAIEGSENLFIIKLKAKKKVQFDLQAKDGILVDKDLNYIKF